MPFNAVIFTGGELKITYGELYSRTIARENLLKESVYNIVSIWESDWDEQNKVEDLPEDAEINWLDPKKVTPPTYSKKVEKVLK